MYQNKLQEERVQDVINGDLVNQAFAQFNENLINDQDPNSQIENDETSGAEYSNESDSE